MKLNLLKQTLSNKRKNSFDTAKLIQNSKEKAAKLREFKRNQSQNKREENTENSAYSANSKSSSWSSAESVKISPNNTNKIHDRIPVKSDEFILIPYDKCNDIVSAIPKKIKFNNKVKRGFKTKRSSMNSSRNNILKSANNSTAKKLSPKLKRKVEKAYKIKNVFNHNISTNCSLKLKKRRGSWNNKVIKINSKPNS